MSLTISDNIAGIKVQRKEFYATTKMIPNNSRTLIRDGKYYENLVEYKNSIVKCKLKRPYTSNRGYDQLQSMHPWQS